MSRLTVLSLFLACAVSGCSAIGDTETADRYVVTFHYQLDNGQFGQIYDASAEAMKKSATRDNFVAMLDAVHSKLGAMKSTSRTGVKINFDGLGEHIELFYKTSYAGGEAQERFDFRKDANEPLLSGYHVSSPVLGAR